ncbi:MAG: hypothetical protein KKE76_13340 [Gammaproteobacteria bacterium]|nr:hypothetical protein [Gammaproteobacteria bacterium]
MINFALASSMDPKGSVISRIGKFIVVLARIFLILSFAYMLFYAFFLAKVGGISGVGILGGVYGWVIVEFIGSAIFYVGQIGVNKDHG